MNVGIYLMCLLQHMVHSYMYQWSVPFKVKVNCYFCIVVELEEKPLPNLVFCNPRLCERGAK
jgi:hypothetical protein